jgi:hypothetical protein
VDFGGEGLRAPVAVPRGGLVVGSRQLRDFIVRDCEVLHRLLPELGFRV